MKICLRLFLALSCALAFAQQDRGLITGVIKDGSGAVITDANVTATRTETNTVIRVSSGNSGDYTLPSLEIGTYTVRVEKAGFKTSVTNNIIV
jgi:hypothetical protein